MKIEELIKKIETLENEVALLDQTKKNSSLFLIHKLIKRRVILPLLIVFSTIVASIAFAATIPNSFSAGDVISASNFNDNFSYIVSRLWDLSGSDFYYNSGNVGIGTSSPGSILHLSSSDPSVIFDTETVTDTDFWMGIQEDSVGSDDDTFQIGDGTSPGANPFFSIDTSGNVGIGTTSPDGKLSIENTTSGKHTIHGAIYRVTGLTSVANGTVTTTVTNFFTGSGKVGEITIVGYSTVGDSTKITKFTFFDYAAAIKISAGYGGVSWESGGASPGDFTAAVNGNDLDITGDFTTGPSAWSGISILVYKESYDPD